MPVIGIIRAVACAGLLVMVFTIGYAWQNGDFVANGAAILDLPWGLVSLLDAYTGMVLIGCWILFRESRLSVGAIWVLSILIIGNLASCLYILIATLRTRGDLQRFWLGARADEWRASAAGG